MTTSFYYGRDEIYLRVPDDSIVYASDYPALAERADRLLEHSVTHPVGGLPLQMLLHRRREGKVVIVVSDITRPIPYRSFLSTLLDAVTSEGVLREEIVILVATGMHRPSTIQEKIEMFGQETVDRYTIIDHNAEEEAELAALSEASWSGTEVKLNRHYVEAGFRILTGLVEPHFMAGFSGGRKAICPGLASLQTIKMFHGYRFLSDPHAANTVLEGNPCHLENSSIARICPADFSVNIVLDRHKQLNHIVSGDPCLSHEATIAYVKKHCCKAVTAAADVALTSCGGYPLDDTFYQCVKGFVNTLPALKRGGIILAFGSCTEGIGSPEYRELMMRYSHRIHDFLHDIRNGQFVKDQWQFQMHIRVLEQIGAENLHFFNADIPADKLERLSVHAHPIDRDKLVDAIQMEIDRAVASGKRMAIFPEGPYCAPYKPLLS
jgi:nickel-dependent lactate racemase